MGYNTSSLNPLSVNNCGDGGEVKTPIFHEETLSRPWTEWGEGGMCLWLAEMLSKREEERRVNEGPTKRVDGDEEEEEERNNGTR